VAPDDRRDPHRHPSQADLPAHSEVAGGDVRVPRRRFPLHGTRMVHAALPVAHVRRRPAAPARRQAEVPGEAGPSRSHRPTRLAGPRLRRHQRGPAGPALPGAGRRDGAEPPQPAARRRRRPRQDLRRDRLGAPGRNPAHGRRRRGPPPAAVGRQDRGVLQPRMPLRRQDDPLRTPQRADRDGILRS
jgi:hypothetical protein